jgi:hypothetical protein
MIVKELGTDWVQLNVDAIISHSVLEIVHHESHKMLGQNKFSKVVGSCEVLFIGIFNLFLQVYFQALGELVHNFFYNVVQLLELSSNRSDESLV